jgi:hypothetical protein
MPVETAPASREAPFLFEGRTPDEIMAEFKEVSDAHDGWSVGGRFKPFDVGLSVLCSFDPSEKPLVIKQFLEDYFEHYMSPSARSANPDIEPDVAAWPAHAAWMNGALDLYMRLSWKWYSASRDLNNAEWKSRASQDALRETDYRHNRLAYLRSRVSEEINRREATLFRRRQESDSRGGR